MSDRPAPAVRVVVRPYATALPLGCFAFGIGNAIIAAFTAHWIPVTDTQTVAVMMLVFVAPLELVSCIFAFLSRDTGAATAMGIFAASWVVLGIQYLAHGQAATSAATGLFLILLALCLAILAAGSFSGKPIISALFCVAMLRSLAAGMLEFEATDAVTFAAVALGLALATLAFYCGVGLYLEDVFARPLAMMLRFGKAETAMRAGLSEQLENVGREAGVRPQL